MRCPYCGEQHSEQAIFCPRTGKTLPVRSDVCKHCGASLPAEVGFCPACGKAVATHAGRAMPAWVRRAWARPGARTVSIVCAVFAAGLLLIVTNGWRFKNPARPTPTSTARHPTATSIFPDYSNLPDRNPIPLSAGTQTPVPRPSITAAPGPWPACSDTYKSRLHVGDRAYVSYQPPLANRVRSDSNLQGRILGEIQPGEYVKILRGPACANNWVWWFVRTEKNSLQGWTSEGDSETYWLVPVP